MFYIHDEGELYRELYRIGELQEPEECREALTIIQAQISALERQSSHFAAAPEEYGRLIQTALRAAVLLQQAIAEAHREGDTVMLGPLLLARSATSRLHNLLSICPSRANPAV